MSHMKPEGNLFDDASNAAYGGGDDYSGEFGDMITGTDRDDYDDDEEVDYYVLEDVLDDVEELVYEDWEFWEGEDDSSSEDDDMEPDHMDPYGRRPGPRGRRPRPVARK